MKKSKTFGAVEFITYTDIDLKKIFKKIKAKDEAVSIPRPPRW